MLSLFSDSRESHRFYPTSSALPLISCSTSCFRLRIRSAFTLEGKLQLYKCNKQLAVYSSRCRIRPVKMLLCSKAVGTAQGCAGLAQAFRTLEILQGPMGCRSSGRETPPLKLPFCYFLKPKKISKEHHTHIHFTSLERRQTCAGHFGRRCVFLWRSGWNTQENEPEGGVSGHLAPP